MHFAFTSLHPEINPGTSTVALLVTSSYTDFIYGVLENGAAFQSCSRLNTRGQLRSWASLASTTALKIDMQLKILSL